ncbi:CgeB family protein [Novispirillum sp. DQ9]|uniref:CgeB family protein n=1 Tax=Novispirillum sp. DQ9 TaxID=3398612 RepID=UPI003C7DC203
MSLNIVFLGLSITSSWGNGHATTFRALIRALAAEGHRVTFLERDMPWYAANRDLPDPPWCRTHLYDSVVDLQDRYIALVRHADAVIVGSFVPDGVEVGAWVREVACGTVAFYDIDTPVTLAKLERGDHEYISPNCIRGYDLYLSFTGGPTLRRLETDLGAPMARALYCSVDPDAYFPDEAAEPAWDLGYLGTWSADRQPTVDRLLNEPARRVPAGRFVVAGPQYPDDTPWPANVERIDHLPPAAHRSFYTRQRFTLNVTRADMVAAGWAPSVRLFEAAACGTPIISDWWTGLDTLFKPGEEILIGDSPETVTEILTLMPEARRRAIGRAARERILSAHTASHRARELVVHLHDAAAVRLQARTVG